MLIYSIKKLYSFFIKKCTTIALRLQYTLLITIFIYVGNAVKKKRKYKSDRANICLTGLPKYMAHFKLILLIIIIITP